MSTATLENVRRILRVATGDEYPDGELITEYGIGYAESRYGTPDQVWVLGNWNPRRFPRDGEPALRPEENVGPRLFAALERLGAKGEWLDEWDPCQECYKLVRTQPDSYGWTAQFAWLEDVGIVCHGCLLDVYGQDALDEFINNHRKAITWCEPPQVVEWGFAKWEPGNEHDYENGWYPGQTDDPEKILDEIHAAHEDAEVVFFIDSVGQFDVHFSAYFRIPESE